MIMQGNEVPNGWPLGLGNMNSTIGELATSQLAAPPPLLPPPPPPPPPPYTVYRVLRSSSFSSFTSSNLDTESTMSFLPDRSVTLGRLIGIRPVNGNRGSSSSCNNGNTCHQLEKSSVDISQGLCAPLLCYVMRKTAKNGRSTSSYHQ